ncbi:MAG: cobalamin biosynthesis protein CobQ [Phormidesmis sp.]
MASPFLKRYLLALNRYKWAGLFTFLSILGASVVVALQPEPPVTYSSEGVLVNNSPLVAFTDTGSQVQSQGLGIINEELLLSDILLEEVANQLAAKSIDFTPAQLVARTKINVQSASVTDGVEATGQKVTVRFTGSNPEVTETVLRTMFEAMVELSAATNKQRLKAIATELNERLPEIEGELRQAEQRLEAYDRNEGPAIQASIDGSLLGAISGSQQQLRTNEITLAGIEAQMRSLQSQLGMNPVQAYASSALSADPIVAQLRAQISEAQTAIALQRAQGLRDQHPTLVGLNESLNAYQGLLARRSAEVLGGDGSVAPIPSGTQSNLDPARAALASQLVSLDSQREAIISQQKVISESAQRLRQDYASLPNKELERNRLAQQVVLRRAFYDRIQAGLIDAEAAEAETVSSLVVASAPYTKINVTERPAAPMILLAGTLMGLIVGGGVIYLLDMLDGTTRTTEEIEGILEDQEVPLLGIIPAIEIQSLRSMPVLIQSESIYHSSYERLLSRIKLLGMEDSENVKEYSTGPQMIVLTSAQAKEGKSLSAYNMAIASARAGRRTLLIEADFRNPSKADAVGIDYDPQTADEPLRYYGGQIGSSIQMVFDIENLYVSPSPGLQRQPTAIIESSEMQRFLKDAKARFDMVILDTPSLSSCDDALLLEPQTDGLVLIARPGITTKADLDSTLESMEFSEDIRLLGVVVNAAGVPIKAKAATTKSIAGSLERSPEPWSPRTVPSGRIDF